VATSETVRNLDTLEADLKRLEAEYNMFFAGRLPRPPFETRNRVEKLLKTYDRAHMPNYGDRFRLTTLQTRFATFVDLWDRGLRAREEGRAGPFVQMAGGRGEAPPSSLDRIMHVAAFREPADESDKLRALYESFGTARRAVGADNVSFGRFSELVAQHVEKMKVDGSSEVAFRVAVKDGRVSLTARALRKPSGGE
jgi:hypothetical protein